MSDEDELGVRPRSSADRMRVCPGEARDTSGRTSDDGVLGVVLLVAPTHARLSAGNDHPSSSADRVRVRLGATETA